METNCVCILTIKIVIAGVGEYTLCEIKLVASRTITQAEGRGDEDLVPDYED